MEILDAIYQRRAVRSYLDQPVENTTIEALLDAAIHAPSAMNTQPWAFAIWQDKELLANYSARAKAYGLATLAGNPHGDHWRVILSQSDYNIFYDAPVLIVICAKPDDGLMPVEDCCLAAQNLMLAAHAMGLGSCPIGFARRWMNLPEVKQELGIPAEYTPVFPVIVGYPKELPPPTERNDPEIIVWRQ